jgi:hypothetical protein
MGRFKAKCSNNYETFLLIFPYDDLNNLSIYFALINMLAYEEGKNYY